MSIISFLFVDPEQEENDAQKANYAENNRKDWKCWRWLRFLGKGRSTIRTLCFLRIPYFQIVMCWQIHCLWRLEEYLRLRQVLACGLQPVYYYILHSNLVEQLSALKKKVFTWRVTSYSCTCSTNWQSQSSWLKKEFVWPGLVVPPGSTYDTRTGTCFTLARIWLGFVKFRASF